MGSCVTIQTDKPIGNNVKPNGNEQIQKTTDDDKISSTQERTSVIEESYVVSEVNASKSPRGSLPNIDFDTDVASPTSKVATPRSAKMPKLDNVTISRGY